MNYRMIYYVRHYHCNKACYYCVFLFQLLLLFKGPSPHHAQPRIPPLPPPPPARRSPHHAPPPPRTQERDTYNTATVCRALERSVFSDRMVFVRAVHAAKFMSDTELAIYDSWFDPILNTLPTLVPNGFIYLRAQPETCHRRMTKRARSEESKVSLDYLEVCGVGNPQLGP